MICAALGSVNSTLRTDTISLAGSTNAHMEGGEKKKHDHQLLASFFFWTHSHLKRSSLPAVGAVCTKKNICACDVRGRRESVKVLPLDFKDQLFGGKNLNGMHCSSY